MPSTAGFPTLGAMSTTTLGVTATAYNSFVTPAISVPFPSYYGGQTQVAFQWTDMPSLDGAQPTQIGGAQATNGVQSIMREFRATAINPTPNKGDASKGFEWPTWATAVIAGCGGAALIALVAGTCCWRRARKRKQRDRQQAQRVDDLSKRASAYLSHEQQARDGFAGTGAALGDKQSRRRNRKGAQPLPEKNGFADDYAHGKTEGGADAPVAAAAVGALAAAHSHKAPHKGKRLSKQYAHGQKPATHANQMHDYDYPPYPMPPPAVAPSPTTNTPVNSRDIDYRAGTTGYRPVAMNASTYSLNNDSSAAVHHQHYTPGYGQPGMVYPTDDHGNPIMPGLRGHRRVASDDSGYNTPTTMGAGNDSYSLQGSPARLLANAAPLSSRSRNASGNSEQWTSPGGNATATEHDAGMAIGGAMLGHAAGRHHDDVDLAPPVPVAMLPPGQRLGTPERKRNQPRQRADTGENRSYAQDDVRNRQMARQQAYVENSQRLNDGLRDSARLSRQPSPTYALLGGYTDDNNAAPRARSAQSNYRDARSAPSDTEERSQSAQSLRTGKRYGRRPADVQVPPPRLYDSSHNVPLSPSVSSPAYASSSGDASSPGYTSEDYRDAQQAVPGQAL
ncbi:hypothetical protein OIV83_001082 [Microbotryomycetes sp. JL201]|nr:hypothetical protein OIV83_001082 [Microbotryomycetes sp. JL201]